MRRTIFGGIGGALLVGAAAALPVIWQHVPEWVFWTLLGGALVSGIIAIWPAGDPGLVGQRVALIRAVKRAHIASADHDLAALTAAIREAVELQTVVDPRNKAGELMRVFWGKAEDTAIDDMNPDYDGLRECAARLLRALHRLR